MRRYFVIIVWHFAAYSITAQTHVVHGKLTAFGTYPVQNIEVRSQKGKSATLSDSLGHFSIVCYENDVILIKSKAFRPEKRKVGPETDSLNINLVFLNSRKNRQIAVGYGYINEEDLGYAVSNLQQENNEFCNYKDIYDVILGRFAGVDVVNRQVIIRGAKSFYGSNEALYVVDGMVVSSIDWISPCEIKSISILKDASAAVYGSRGANGVVMIELIKAD